MVVGVSLENLRTANTEQRLIDIFSLILGLIVA
jgi:hypothetical protein